MAGRIAYPLIVVIQRLLWLPVNRVAHRLGAQIRQLLLDPALSQAEEITSEAELLLYAADRAQHVIQYIQPRLKAGQIVLCDRFTDSTVAYQGYGRQLNLELIEQINQLATFGLTSDLTLWFDVDVSTRV